ncbi:hypothetical protein L228DRAFT_247303 [Xylona heveae TC161]|uniref:Transmembrane protein 135 N-terminal domain-containing protein n=1 Tax=Xylona heveae (strain CBS 132557 / TC161) TaxID=1328760 RepID=A0A165H2A3_XYLHT|nr:hypothetical protein L228DRAFT_247303 [Xylona heveae TC161]KZF22890.1 hypothetical protein L228DRAFT_247303 [Xylona heveae TC161]
MASAPSPNPSASAGNPKVDPILRNALRYTVSAKEYELLHQYLLSRASAVRRRAPRPPRYESFVRSKDDYNAAAIRASLRVFFATQAGLKLWELITTKLIARGRISKPLPKTSIFQSRNLRLSFSLSFILFLHRILYRFFTRLRENLLTPDAAPFRRRNPRVTRVLISRLAPAIGASLAGFSLGLYPSDQLRVTIAIYMVTRAAEFVYNSLEDQGWFQDRPWWFGSWLLMPFAYGQLLHAFVFDRECFPQGYGDFILKRSPNYIQQRPEDYPAQLAWPDTYEIVDSLAEMAHLNWPPFTSPILFPNKETLPPSLTTIAPITDPAHPGIKPLSCAVLHPNDPSCLRTYLTFYIRVFPQFARIFALVLTGMSILRYKSFLATPISSTNALAKSILKLTLSVTGAIGSAWASICLFQHVFPRSFLPTQRFFLGGFLAGFWAFLTRRSGRSNFLYSARMSIDSLWKVGVKRGWWRGVRNGDVWLFVLSLALTNAVYDVNPKAVTGGAVRKSLSVLRGQGWVDRARAKSVVDTRDGEAEE